MLVGNDVQRKQLADKRIKKVNELISGVKMIKFNAWEKIMLKLFIEIRQQEKPKITRSFAF